MNIDTKIVTKIAIYFILAFGLTFFLNTMPNPLATYGYKVNLNVGLGPFLAAIIVSFFYKMPLLLNFFSKITWIRRIELIGMAIFFIGSFAKDILVNKTDYMFVLCGIVLALLYTLLEEAGWRMFLGKALEQYSFLTLFLVSTALWFSWHYAFQDENLLANPVKFLAMIAAGSAGMAQFYRLTKSWMIVALTHAVISVNLPTIIIFLVAVIRLIRLQEAKEKQSKIL